MMKKRKLEWWPFVLFIGLTVCLMLMWSLRKEGWFLDEVYSYGLSNSTEGPFLTDLHDDWENGTVFDRDELMQYVMVAENERFDYATVYYNQTQDVHPPLYYFFLHTVCSLFPGSFTKWTGIGLNFVFLGCTLAAMYALALELLHDSKKALFACALYVFNRQAVTHFMLIRMYMLLTLLTVLLALLVAKSLHRPSIGKDLAIGVVIYLGMMTQYFYVVYAFLLCAAYDLYRLHERKWKEIFLFSIPALAGVVGMLLSFPSWCAQLHSQENVSLEATATHVLDLTLYPIRMGTMLTWHTLNFWTGAVILAVMVIVAIYRKIARKSPKSKTGFTTELKLITVPAIVAVLVISIIAPYQVIRYFTHLQPLEAIFFSCGFFDVTGTLQRRKEIAIGFLAAAFLTAVIMEPENLYLGDKKLNTMLEAYASDPCVLVSDKSNPSITSLLPQLLYFDSICVTDDICNDISESYRTEKTGNKEMILAVATYPETQMTEDEVYEFAKQENYKTVEKISEKGLAVIYLLQKDE